MESQHSIVIESYCWLLFARFQSTGCWKFYLVHTHRARRLSPPVLAWPGSTLPKTEPRRNAGQ